MGPAAAFLPRVSLPLLSAILGAVRISSKVFGGRCALFGCLMRRYLFGSLKRVSAGFCEANLRVLTSGTIEVGRLRRAKKCYGPSGLNPNCLGD